MEDTAESYCGLLRLFDTFSRAEDHSNPSFSYRHEDEKLTGLLSQYCLDEHKGDGDPLDQIISLMIWLQDTITYNGLTRNSFPMDSLSLLPPALKQRCGLNCRMMATILVEVYLALGFCARIVSLHGLSPYDGDNHVVALVWLESKCKWVLMDPSLGQYYRDEDGVYLDPRRMDLVRREGLHLEWRRRSGIKNRQWDDALAASYLMGKTRLENDALLWTRSRSTFFKAPIG